MADRISPEARSRNMGRIRSRDTKPEVAVRRALHAAGYRFRLHHADLPGRPDIVLPRHRTVIFVHGCFWHRHEGCQNASTPGTRIEFWLNKFAANAARDRAAETALVALGWNVIVIWECETGKPDQLDRIICARLPSVAVHPPDQGTV